MFRFGRLFPCSHASPFFDTADISITWNVSILPLRYLSGLLISPPSGFWIEWQTINNHGQIIFSPARLVLLLIKLRWSRELWSQTRTRATCYTSQQNSYQCDEYLHCTAPNMMSVKSRGPSSDSDVDRSCIQSSTEPGMRIAIVRSPISKLTSSSVEWYPGWLKKSI